MKGKIKEILATAKGIKPSYFIQYTVVDGEIVITGGCKSFDGSPSLIFSDVTAEQRSNDEVIAKFEKDGIDEEKVAIILELLEREIDKDQIYLNYKED